MKAPFLTHFLGITAATAAIILCTLRPFLPGRYDGLAVPMSAMSQLFGVVGLSLVPVGALWMASARWSRLAGKRRLLALASVVVSSVVWVIVSLGAFVHGGLSLGLGALALGAFVVSRISPRLTSSVNATAPASAIPFYMIIVPAAVALLQLALAGPAAEFGRSRAIQNSARLIADIEQYRATHGRYPTSLLSVNDDYLPSVIGVKEFHYEMSGGAYNVFFEQFSFQLGTREFVMYNPLDQHVMTSHDMDLLQRTSEELEARRGHYAVHDAREPHWKYFLFD